MHRRQDSDRPPSRRAGLARRTGKGSCAAPLVLALGVLLGAGAAWGDCVQSGDAVTCSAPGDGGFDAAGQDGLTVTIEAGAEVAASVPGTGGISLANGSTVEIEAGTLAPVVEDGRIDISADGAIGIWGGDDNTVRNFGIISGVGADTRGILLAGDQDADSWVEQRGELSLTGDSAIGIAVGAAGQIGNFGEMTLTGDSVIGMSVGAGGTAVTANGSEMTLTGDSAIGIDIESALRVDNLGSIVVDGANGVGVRATGSGNFIRNEFGTIEVTGAGGIAVSLEGAAAAGDSNEIENKGVITAEGGTALRGSESVEDVINSGAMTGYVDLGGGDDSFAHGGTLTGDVDLGAGDDRFENAGSIEGDVDFGPGQDRYILYPAGSITGAVHGGDDSDTFVLGGFGLGTFDLSDPSAVVTSFEALEINTTETWTVSGSGSFAQGTRVVRGTLDLEGGVSLEGGYTQGAGTSLAVHLTSDDRLTVQDGDLAIESGATLVLTTSEELPEDLDYTILDATSGSLTGRFQFVEYPSNAGPWPLVLDYSASRLSLGRETYASLAATSNGVVVGGYLDDLALADVSEFDELFDALPGPQPGTSYDEEYLQLSPESYDAHTSAALSWGRGVTSVLKRRPLRCRSHVYQGLPDVRSESPCGEKGWMPWAEPLGRYAKRDGGFNYVSYDQLGAGLAVGADKRLDERWTVSAGLAAGRIGIDFGSLGNGTLTTFDLAAAGSLLLGPAHVRAVVSYGHGWHTTRRDIDLLGLRATGDHDSNRIGLLLEAGYEFELGPIRIEPLVELDYTYVTETTLAEGGAGVQSLRVDERSSSQVATAAGLRVSGTYYKYAYLGSWFEWLDGVITPELSARWRRVWTGDDRDVEARMIGAPREVGSFEVAADDASAGLELGTRVTFQPQWTRNTVELGYDVFIGNDTTVHNLGAKLRIPF